MVPKSAWCNPLFAYPLTELTPISSLKSKSRSKACFFETKKKISVRTLKNSLKLGLDTKILVQIQATAQKIRFGGPLIYA